MADFQQVLSTLYHLVSCALQLYFNKAPGKVGHVRVDTLALLLSLANIGAHAKVRGSAAA